MLLSYFSVTSACFDQVEYFVMIVWKIARDVFWHGRWRIQQKQGMRRRIARQSLRFPRRTYLQNQDTIYQCKTTLRLLQLLSRGKVAKYSVVHLVGQKYPTPMAIKLIQHASDERPGAEKGLPQLSEPRWSTGKDGIWGLMWWHTSKTTMKNGIAIPNQSHGLNHTDSSGWRLPSARWRTGCISG